MRPVPTFGLTRQPWWSQRTTKYMLEQNAKVLRNISFGQTTGNNENDRNIVGYKATGTTPGVANTEFSVAHNLRWVPIGFLILSVTPAGHLYKSTTAWTAATLTTLGAIFLKSDAISVTYVIMVI